MRIFQHKLNGNYYRLVKSNKGSVNTFLQVDIENKLKTDFVEDVLKRGQQLVDDACALEDEIMKITNSKIN